MIITLKGKDIKLDTVRLAIYDIARDSRFNFNIDTLGPSRIKIKDVRLKESKRYCGNHPNSCEVDGGRMGKYLEGLDWVEFNDRLNDVLDKLNVNALVRSSVCEIRQGKKRRINYDSHLIPNMMRELYEWDRKGEDSDYEDYCGKEAPDSMFPFGTPGDYERMV